MTFASRTQFHVERPWGQGHSRGLLRDYEPSDGTFWVTTTYTPCLAHVVTRVRTWLFLPHFYPFLTDMVAMKKKRQWYSVTCRGGRVLTVPGPACRILFVKWSVRVPLSSPAPVASSGKITISKELMLGCINKNSFRLLLISLQIVKANDSYLPLCSLMIFLK